MNEVQMPLAGSQDLHLIEASLNCVLKMRLTRDLFTQPEARTLVAPFCFSIFKSRDLYANFWLNHSPWGGRKTLASGSLRRRVVFAHATLRIRSVDR